MLEFIKQMALEKRKSFPEMRSGDTVEVAIRVKEGEKERTQIFKGVVIKIQSSGMGRSFTVRKVSENIGVERTFPYTNPSIESVKVLARGAVRRSKLYYLRQLAGKASRISSERIIEAQEEAARSEESSSPEEDSVSSKESNVQ